MVKWPVSEITKRSRSSLKVILPLTPSPGHRFHRFLTSTSGVIQHLRGLDSVVWLWRQESCHWYPHVPPEHGLVPSLPPRILPSWPMELHLSRDMNRETSWSLGCHGERVQVNWKQIGKVGVAQKPVHPTYPTAIWIAYSMLQFCIYYSKRLPTKDHQ